MPLSEHEQKMLDEMERQLFAEDPRLARRLRTTESTPRDRRRIVIGMIGVLLGLGLLVLAVSLPAIWLGVLAFVLMLASALHAIGPRSTPEAGGTGARNAGGDRRPAPASGKGRSDFMRRMEERWEKRSGPGA